MCGTVSAENGKKGGRPKYYTKTVIPGISLVILTPNQYNSLLEKYGYDLLKKALIIFENWLKSSPKGEKYVGRNNYGHFRSDGWVINTAKSID